MQTYIAMALLLLPGFLFKNMINELTDSPLKKNTFEKTIVSLLWSIPILVLNLIWIKFKWGIISYKELIIRFEDLDFILHYIILSFISFSVLLIIYVLFKRIKKKFPEVDMTNILRKSLGYEMKTGKENPWQDFFNYDDIMAVEIYSKGNKICGGFIENWDLEGFDYQDIIVGYIEEFEEYKTKYKEKKSKDLPVKNIYINPTKELVIKEYLFDAEVLRD